MRNPININKIFTENEKYDVYVCKRDEAWKIWKLLSNISIMEVSQVKTKRVRRAEYRVEMKREERNSRGRVSRRQEDRKDFKNCRTGRAQMEIVKTEYERDRYSQKR